MHPETRRYWQVCADILRPYDVAGNIDYPADREVASMLHCASRLLLAMNETEPLDARVANLAIAHEKLGEVPSGQCPAALCDAAAYARSYVCDAVRACVAVESLCARKRARKSAK